MVHAILLAGVISTLVLVQLVIVFVVYAIGLQFQIYDDSSRNLVDLQNQIDSLYFVN